MIVMSIEMVNFQITMTFTVDGGGTKVRLLVSKMIRA